MYLKGKALRLAVCASSVMAMLAWAPAHAADGKKRVHVKYSSRSASKPAVKSHTNRESVPLTVAGLPNLKSAAALVIDLIDGQTIYAKNTQNVTPIASITKLMTAMVVLDADLHLDETIYINSADFDLVKHTNSRLTVGTGLPRRDMLRLALMSSENRAAASLGRAYPGGSEAFVMAMNRKALELGMSNTRFVDATGLSSDNVSTAEDLVKMVRAAYQYQLIREFTTTPAHEVETMAGRNLQFRNSNGLIQNPAWEIGLSKTGYISEAGRCLVMQAMIAARPVVIVLLDSLGKQTRIGDANRLKKWIEGHFGRMSLG
jgi:serine-type D-Ala-D-Ala endopeptidase (penicillin-binding protein 7)